MQEWEYRIVEFDKLGLFETSIWDTGLPSLISRVPSKGMEEHRLLKLQVEYLDKLGAEGWEVIGAIGSRFVLRRTKL